MCQNLNTDFFDVPFCRIEEQNLVFSNSLKAQNEPNDQGNQDLTIVTEYKHSMINERLKYSNKLLKQFESIGLTEDSGSGVASSALSYNSSSDPVCSNFNYTQIVDETLSALTSSMSDTEDIMSEWDPMRTAYEQKNFNSYEETPFNANVTEKHSPIRGTRISPAKGNSDEVTLFVGNIPISLEEDGLRNMFSQCGRCKVRKCKPKIHDSNSTFGFVTYGSVKDAEGAISEYNDFPFGDNLKLKVRLSKNYAVDNSNQFVPLAEDIILGPSNIEIGNVSSSSDKDDLRNVNVVNTPTPMRMATNTTPPVLRTSKETSSMMNHNLPRLYIKGLPANFTNEQLQSLLNRQVPCHDCLVIKPKLSNQRTTYGFASFNNTEDADAVIACFNDEKINNRDLQVSYSKQSAQDYGKKLCNSEEDDHYASLYGDLDSSFTGVDVDLWQFRSNDSSNNCHGSGDVNTENNSNDDKEKMKEVKKTACKNAVHGMMLNDLPIKPFPGDQMFQVCVTEIVSPHFFYGQLLSDESFVAIAELSESLQETYQNPDLPIFTPKLNEICVAKYPEDNQWYRASVVLYNNDYTARMFFFDFGNKYDVETSDIRFINENFLRYPRLALKFCLTDTQGINNNGVWSNDTVPFMNSLLANKAAKVTGEEIDGDIMKCSIELDTGEDLLKQLIERGCRKSMSSGSTPAVADEKVAQVANTNGSTLPSSVSPASRFQLPTEQSFNVLTTHVQDPSLFYCQIATTENIQKSIDIVKDLADSLQGNTTSYTPLVNEVCAGFHENYGEWYRVLVKSVHAKQATVYLVDYGEALQLPLAAIRKLPDRLKNINAIAFPMSLADVKPVGKEWCGKAIHAMAEHLTPMKKSCAYVVHRHSDKLDVKITHDEQEMGQMLIMKNLATSSTESSTTTNLNAQEKVVQSENTVDQNGEVGRNVDRYTNLPSIDIPDYDVSQQIIVTHIESFDLFYAIIFNTFGKNKLNEISGALAEHCKTNKNVFPPSLNSLCCALHEDQWFRAFVLDIGQSTVKVFFIDFGNTSDVAFDNVCEFPHSCIKLLRNVPSLVVALKLHNPSSISSDEKMLGHFKNNVLNQLVNMKVVNKNITPIEIQILEHPIDSFKCLEPETVDLSQSETRPVKEVHSQTGFQRVMEDTISKIEVPTSNDIAIVHIDSLNDFYGQLLDSLQQMDNFTNELSHDLNGNKTTSNYIPVVGEICAGFFISFEQYFRVRVTSVDTSNNTVVVQSIDYGNTQKLSFDDVVPLSTKYASLPAQAINFALHDICDDIDGSNKASTNNCIQYFGSKCMNQRATFTVVKEIGCKYFVRLVVNGEDVKEQLEIDGYLHVPKKIESLSPLQEVPSSSTKNDIDQYTNLPTFNIPKECDVMVTHVENLDKFFVQIDTDNNVEKLQALNENLFSHCEGHILNSFKPEVNNLCLARYGSESESEIAMWYRAYALGVGTSHARVLFIDYGNLGELPFEDIRPFDDQFLTAPSLAVQCKLHNPSNVPSTSPILSHFQSIGCVQISSMKVLNVGHATMEVALRVNHDDLVDILEKYHIALQHDQPNDVDMNEPKVENNVVNKPLVTEMVVKKQQLSTDVKPSTTAPVTQSATEIIDVKKTSKDPTVLHPKRITTSALKLDDNEDLNTVSSIPEITKANYPPIKTSAKSNAAATAITKPKISSNVNGSLTFVPSTLPSTVHPLESVLMKMDVRDLASGTYELRITHIESPHMMYANVLDREVLHEIQKLSNEMSTFFLSGLPMQTETTFRAGMICAAFDVTEDLWRRVILTKVDQSASTVFFIDRGHLMDLSNVHIKPLLKQFKALPAQAIPLKLITAKPADGQLNWSIEVLEYLKNTIGGQIVKVRPQFKENVLFGVHIKFAGQLLDTLLEQSGHAVKIEPEMPRATKFIPLQEIGDVIEFEKPPESFEGIVSCVINPRLFYCRVYDSANLNKVEGINNKLKELFSNKSSHYEFSKKELCAVHHEGTWYRGYTLYAIAEDAVDIWLIDYGLKIQAPKNLVHPLPENMAQFPAQCVTLQLQYVIPLDHSYRKETISRFRELTLGRLLSFKVLNVHEHLHRVIVRDEQSGIDIGETLVQEGLAKFIYTKDFAYPNSHTNGNHRPSEKGDYLLPTPNHPQYNADDYHYPPPPWMRGRGVDHYRNHYPRNLPRGRALMRGRGVRGMMRGRGGHHGGKPFGGQSTRSNSRDSTGKSERSPSYESKKFPKKSPPGRSNWNEYYDDSYDAYHYYGPAYDPYHYDHHYYEHHRPYSYRRGGGRGRRGNPRQ